MKGIRGVPVRVIITLISILLAAPAAADIVDTKGARAQLYPVKGYSVRVSSSLSAEEQGLVRGIVPLMAEQLRQPVRYYASIAYSPDDGLVHEALQAAMNYHSFEASDAAAVSACNKLRSSGAASCRVAARVLPKGFEPRVLTLSVDATAGFERQYRKAKGPKFFATSRATGAWGMGTSDGAALSACGAQDCAIVIRN